MNQEQRKLLGELGKSSYGKVLSIYLEQARKKIDSVDGVKTIEEALAKQIALEIIDEIFGFMASNPQGQNKKTHYN